MSGPPPTCKHGTVFVDGKATYCPLCRELATAIAATQINPAHTPLTTLQHSGFSRPWRIGSWQ